VRGGKRRTDLETFESLFESGARRAHLNADLFFEDLCGPAPSAVEPASAREDTEVRLDAVVGQPIVVDLATYYPGMTIEKFDWSISGKAVGGYDIGIKRARAARVDTRRTNLTLFWLEGGIARIRCKVRLGLVYPPGAGFDTALQLTYDVRAPSLDHLTAKTSAPIIHDVVIDRRTGKKQKQLGFGDRTGRAGVEWDLGITLPRGVSGQVADLQLVKLGRKRQIQFAGSAPQNEVFRGSARDGYLLDVEGRMVLARFRREPARRLVPAPDPETRRRRRGRKRRTDDRAAGVRREYMHRRLGTRVIESARMQRVG
jgi:hypothetical protein